MTKFLQKLFLTILPLLSISISLLGAVSPEELLKQLPSPSVKYKVNPGFVIPERDQSHEISKPKVSPIPIPPRKEPLPDLKKIKKQIPVLNSLQTIEKVVEHLSRKPIPKKMKVQDDEEAAKMASRMKQLQKSSELGDAIEVLSKYYNYDNLKDYVQERVTFVSSFTLDVANEWEKKALDEEENPTDKNISDNEDEEENDKNSFDSIFAQALKLKKKEKWKEIDALFKKNREAAKTPEGCVYLIEAQLNGTKINYSTIKRNGDTLLRKNQKDPWGNYALALYYVNAKRPNLKKAEKHLNLALANKNPPPGASKLYWMMKLKSMWLILLVLVAGTIGGVSTIIKKKKEAKIAAEGLEEGESSGEAIPSATVEIENEVRPEGFKGKIWDLKQKLKPLLNKLNRKKGTAKPETSQPSEGESAQETANAETADATSEDTSAKAPAPEASPTAEDAPSVETPIETSAPEGQSEETPEDTTEEKPG